MVNFTCWINSIPLWQRPWIQQAMKCLSREFCRAVKVMMLIVVYLHNLTPALFITEEIQAKLAISEQLLGDVTAIIREKVPKVLYIVLYCFISI